MRSALLSFADVASVPSHIANRSEFRVAANVLSLQTRRDLRRSLVAGESEGLHDGLRRDTKPWKLLLDLAADAVSNQELRGLVRAMLMRIKSATDCDGVCILLQPQKEGDYALDFRLEGNSFKERSLVPVAGTIESHVLTTGEPWAGTPEQARANFKDEPLLKEQFSTGCMLPLPGRKRVVGTLSLVRTQHNPYSQDELDFLTGVCSQITLVLENALAWQEISELKEKLAQEKLYLEEEIRSEMNFDQIVGDSPALRTVLQLVQTVAPSNSTVLLLGETGTGKELVARAIHDSSRRKNRTFVKLNCAAIPTGLFESELFGHEKGSFTSAIKQRIGKFEQANGGTLFLDEIGDMSASAQAKVLRALQEGKITRVGGDKDINVDVRVIAATNKDLLKEVEEKNFRLDLYHRLSVIIIHVPSLNERKEDIPLLVDKFLGDICAEYGIAKKTIDKEAISALQQHNWTGNIRELRNVVERLIILSGKSITSIDVETYVLPKK